MEELGATLKEVSHCLNHSGIGITGDLYSHVFADRKAELGLLFDAILEDEEDVHSTGCDTNVIRGAQSL
jgi:hypothetical protein